MQPVANVSRVGLVQVQLRSAGFLNTVIIHTLYSISGAPEGCIAHPSFACPLSELRYQCWEHSANWHQSDQTLSSCCIIVGSFMGTNFWGFWPTRYHENKIIKSMCKGVGWPRHESNTCTMKFFWRVWRQWKFVPVKVSHYMVCTFILIHAYRWCSKVTEKVSTQSYQEK